MTKQNQLKELIIAQLKQKLGKVKQDIELVKEPPPELKITSYGMTVGYIDIITESELTENRINLWKEAVKKGEKLTIIVPKEQKLKITELLWKEGVAEKISIGTYELTLLLP
ncbi:hypothetical protein [Thermodesulfovibrio sp.]|uniref:hypothetical protein n=1 Tax=Thermodesulfovibrio sp. TaxID=2067987 RepID=UPI0030AB8DFC